MHPFTVIGPRLVERLRVRPRTPRWPSARALKAAELQGLLDSEASLMAACADGVAQLSRIRARIDVVREELEHQP